MCHGQKSRFFGDGHTTFYNKSLFHGYINPYYWVDDHPLLYKNNGSLDPGTYVIVDKTLGSVGRRIACCSRDPRLSTFFSCQ